jgi:hypothetical protein
MWKMIPKLGTKQVLANIQKWNPLGVIIIKYIKKRANFYWDLALVVGYLKCQDTDSLCIITIKVELIFKEYTGLWQTSWVCDGLIGGKVGNPVN